MSSSTELDTIGVITINNVAKAAMQLAQLEFAREVADQQFLIAAQYADRAQALHDQTLALLSGDVARWQNVAAPCFDQLIAEACGASGAVANYGVQQSETLLLVSRNTTIADNKIRDAHFSSCIIYTPHHAKEAKYSEASLNTSSLGIAFRRRDRDVERLNATRFANKSQMIAMARNAYDGSNRAALQLAQQYSAQAAQAGAGLDSSLRAGGAAGGAAGGGLLSIVASALTQKAITSVLGGTATESFISGGMSTSAASSSLGAYGAGELTGTVAGPMSSTALTASYGAGTDVLAGYAATKAGTAAAAYVEATYTGATVVTEAAAAAEGATFAAELLPYLVLL